MADTAISMRKYRVLKDYRKMLEKYRRRVAALGRADFEVEIQTVLKELARHPHHPLILTKLDMLLSQPMVHEVTKTTDVSVAHGEIKHRLRCYCEVAQ